MEFFSYISDAFSNLVRVLMSITVFDVIDILLLAVLICVVIKLMQETRAEQLLKGILVLVALFFLVQICQLKVMSFLFQNFFQVGLIAVMIVFQPELRRMLEKVGTAKVPNLVQSLDNGLGDVQARDKCIQGIVDACERLSRTRTGALIVIERQTKLGNIIEQSTVINSDPSPELFCNLFYNKAPLHDGAVIIRNNRIYAAGCFLPITNKGQYVDADLGSRHRAALGMSENSDALIIVVSEETGIISVAKSGQLTRFNNEYNPKEALTNILRDEMPDDSKAKTKGRRRTKRPQGGTDAE